MIHRGCLALALLFACLGAGYFAVWKWLAIPPAAANALTDVSGTLLKVEDVSRSAGPVHPVLDLLIAVPDGGRATVYIRNRDVTLGQFRALAGSEVRARYSGQTGVVYEFFTGGKQLIAYDTSFRQELSTYYTLRDASRLAFSAAAVFCLLGGAVYFWTRRESASRADMEDT